MVIMKLLLRKLSCTCKNKHEPNINEYICIYLYNLKKRITKNVDLLVGGRESHVAKNTRNIKNIEKFIMFKAC